MRPPSSILIVDANICISALLGRSARVDIVHRIGRSRTLAATDRFDEASAELTERGLAR